MVVSKVDRARQFLPFDALKGFSEALRKKEEIYTDKIELSEEMQEKLSYDLLKIEKGKSITVIYYYNRQYVKLEGIVKKIDFNYRKIILENDLKIFFDDIYRIEVK